MGTTAADAGGLYGLGCFYWDDTAAADAGDANAAADAADVDAAATNQRCMLADCQRCCCDGDGPAAAT